MITNKVVVTDFIRVANVPEATYTYVFTANEPEDQEYLLKTIVDQWNSKLNVMIKDKHGKAVSYRRLLRQKKGFDYQLGKLIRDLKNTQIGGAVLTNTILK